MKSYRYQARRTDGEIVAAELPAIDESTARAELESLGYEVLSIEQELDLPSGRSSAARAAEAELPLDVVLASLADDLDDHTASREIRGVIARLQEGGTFEDALAQLDHSGPPYLAGMLRAAVESNNVAEVCTGLVQLRETSAHTRRLVKGVLFYPLALTVVLMALGFLFSLWLLPSFGDLYEEFGLELPPLTEAILYTGHYFPWLMLVATGTLILMICVPGHFGWSVGHRLRGTLPMVGQLYTTTAQGEFAAALATFVRLRTPLGAALDYTSRLIDDQNVARSTRRLIPAVERGMPLSEGLARSKHFNRTLTELVLWGERQSTLGETLRLAAEMFEARVRQRLQFLRRVGPSIAMVVVATTAVTVALALLTPMVRLIEGLSG